MNETVKDITVDSPLEAIQEYLDIEAHKAYNAVSFNSRSEIMANAVGHETAILAVRALNSSEKLDAVQKVFTKAAYESCMVFSNIFDKDGILIGSKDEYKQIYIQDQEAAATIALTHLPEALRAIGINVSSEKVISLIRHVDFTQIMDLTEKRLAPHNMEVTTSTLDQAKQLGDSGIREKLHEMLPATNGVTPYLVEKVDEMSVNVSCEPLSEEDMIIIEMAVRLANATWKSHQVHRAHWEGNDSRIDHTKRDGVFNPYDLLKKEQFIQYTSGDSAFKYHEGLLRVSWEIEKDILELQRVMNSVSNA